eukprot:CAMPEP_0182600144 /NCGR_PEP_ID=MMETSP1324-20130603/90840_1 /TAXON_ID=236786 /ORGANISM="Florenciella sp., Strain RCC1587" /LENGTH=852 /DNA_ID=CAMNT_0024818055 /DNA_START=113 /DNA_END=2671 /DNA_ORIENTATION=-
MGLRIFLEIFDSGRVKIVVVLAQTVSSVGTSIGTKWPQPFRWLSNVYSSTQLNLFEYMMPMSCYFVETNYYHTVLSTTLAPIMVALLIWSAVLVPARWLERCPRDLVPTAHHALWLTLVMLFVILPSVSLTLFRVFDCLEMPSAAGEEPEWLLKADLTRSCPTRHSSATDYEVGMVAYTALMIMVYPIGVPLSFYALLSRPTTLRKIKTRQRHQPRSKRMQTLHFLYGSYKPSHPRAEIVISLWRITMCGLIVFMGETPAIRACSSFIIAGVSAICFREYYPFHNETNNGLAQAAAWQVTATIAFALVILLKPFAVNSWALGSVMFLGSMITVVAAVVFAQRSAAERGRLEAQNDYLKQELQTLQDHLNGLMAVDVEFTAEDRAELLKGVVQRRRSSVWSNGMGAGMLLDPDDGGDGGGGGGGGGGGIADDVGDDIGGDHDNDTFLPPVIPLEAADQLATKPSATSQVDLGDVELGALENKKEHKSSSRPTMRQGPDGEKRFVFQSLRSVWDNMTDHFDERNSVVNDASQIPQKIIDKAEPLLILKLGMLVQVTDHLEGTGWAFGSVMYTPPSCDKEETSGWFLFNHVRAPYARELKLMSDTLGGKDAAIDALAPPDYWESTKTHRAASGAQYIDVAPGTEEYIDVTNHFRATMDLGCGVNPSGRIGFGYPNCKIFSVKRVENIHLWTSFAAKRQTMRLRANAEGRSWPEGYGLEQRLFTGADKYSLASICSGGFNRSFAGKNACLFGKGTYFARDASYSACPQYSAPDAEGVQRMLMCKVLTGEFCLGAKDSPVPGPDPRGGKPNYRIPSQQLYYDSSCGQTEHLPILWVTFNDAQAYPEYQVEFNAGPAK